MRKRLIRYCCVFFMLLSIASTRGQVINCDSAYDQQIQSVKNILTEFQNPAFAKKRAELQTKLEKLVADKERCMKNQENTVKPAPADSIKKAVPTAQPVVTPQPQQAQPKVDSAITPSKDDKLPPTAPALQNKRPQPNNNPKPRPAGPQVKTVIKDTTPPQAPKPEKGLDYSQKIDTIDRNVNSFKVRIGDKEFYYIVVDLDKSDIKLHLHHTRDKYAGHNFSTIEALLSSQEISIPKTEMITNGGMYMHNGQPQGLYIENGKMMAPIDTSDPKNGDNFHLMPNGVFFIKKGEAHILTTDSFKKTELGDSNITYATQSGPMLVFNGKRHSVFTEGSHNEKLRSGVCVLDKKTVVFAICDQINFWDFANFFKDYIKGHNALFLDGSVSRMYLKKGLKGNIRKDMDGTFGPMISVTEK